MTSPRLPAPSLDLSRVKALLFDVDGTLADSDDAMVARVARLLHPLRFLISAEKAGRLSRKLVMAVESPGNWLLEAADRLAVDHLIARFLERRAARENAHPLPVIPGVPEMLAVLHRRFPMAVVSARNNLTTLSFLKAHNLEHFFQEVVTSQTCPRTKPFPDPLLYAAEALGVPIGNCLMIGDTTPDVRAALAAGAQSLSVLCGFGTPKELERAGTQHILASTADLTRLLA
ncbi:MAG TPA: HAD family hydrolase [Anaerolineaceae bacterium]|nr:HAD family hydrolase [Anaerolineaceae bacterium]HOR84334.1 HAD family hydrolase [Anaerolineaceae bacterium]HPL43351.1 HAD family hydrolase [Anaerolineaceae bacterium]